MRTDAPHSSSCASLARPSSTWTSGERKATRASAADLSQYTLKTEWQENRLVFNLNDGHGYAGALALDLPGKISIFEVDPRNTEDTGAGPLLYKEWKVTGKVTGSGKFAANTGPNQLLTLIAQGSGIGCTSAADFTHWSLVMQGPKANYMFFGNLVPLKKE